jgi:hypothetical protein
LALVSVSAEELGAIGSRYYQPALATAYPSASAILGPRHRQLCVLNSVVLTLLVLLLAIEHWVRFLGISVSISANCLPGSPVTQPIQFSSGAYGTPWDTFCLLLLWLWCGWLWLYEKSSPSDSA